MVVREKSDRCDLHAREALCRQDLANTKVHRPELTGLFANSMEAQLWRAIDKGENNRRPSQILPGAGTT